MIDFSDFSSTISANVSAISPNFTTSTDYQSEDLADHDSVRRSPSWTVDGRTLEGSFSTVSKPNFASKYAFDSIFEALPEIYTMHSFA